MIFIDEKFNIISLINSANGLTDNHITYFTQDRVGDVWATNNQLAKISFDSSITYFSKINNLRSYVNSISRIDGKLYVRTGEDLFKLVPPQKITENAFFEKQNINDLSPSGKSVVKFNDQIITTNNYTIKSTKNNTTKIISPKYRSRVTIISKLNPNLIFTSNTSEGLLVHEYKNGIWNEVKLNTTLPCIDLTEYYPGQILLTTKNGVFKYIYTKDGQGTFTKLERNKSFVKNEQLGLRTVNDTTNLFLDSLNNIYVADVQNNKLKFSGFNISNLLNDKSWSYAYNTASHNGWIKKHDGIFKADFNLKEGFVLKKYPFYKVDISELSNALFAEGVGDKEILWIGSQDEKVYRYFPELALKEKHQNYSAIIRAIYSNGQKVPIHLEKLPFSQNNLTFEVAYPVFGNETKTTFSYWLEGQDSAWTSFNSDFKKEYTNLHEGKYKFHVKAKDASGDISTEALLEFKISPLGTEPFGLT